MPAILTDRRHLFVRSENSGFVFLSRSRVVRDLLHPSRRHAQRAGHQGFGTGRNADAGHVYRQECGGDHQEILDISLFHFLLLQLRASVCPMTGRVSPCASVTVFEYRRHQRFPRMMKIGRFYTS